VNPERWRKIDEVLANALEMPAENQRAYIQECCPGDPELGREIEELLEASRSADGFTRPGAGVFSLPEGPADEDVLIGTQVGPYRLVERIGEGGMGAVYRGERSDGQFEQHVAVKLVEPGIKSHELMRRLRSERQILASLNHPNIARLLDGGISTDGHPYLVMEYIEGTPLSDYCKTHTLNIEQRLKLFRPICSAVHYAHQHLVVHRDIKPSNVLVAEDGVPKLLDFGIAKLLEPTAAGSQGSTVTTLNPMTPEYASPEQIQGREVTTASDIYSLGVLLYELLTDQKPHKIADKSPQQVAQAICDTDPEKPSEAVTKNAKAGGTGRTLEPISGDLDHIVLKAMRKEPSQRYASAEELSGDIGNYLAGLPIQARHGSFRYLAGKFIVRHKAAVVLSSALLVALVAGLVIVSWQVRVARMERARAQRRFNDVRKLANSLIFEVHDGIQDLPGSTPTRKLVVSRAAEYLDSLAKDAEGDSSLQMELAAAYARLSRVQLSSGAASLGDRAGAIASNQKAEAILQSVIARDPSSVEARRQLALCYLQDSELSGYSSPDAGPAAKQALTILQKLTEERPNDEALEKSLAKTFLIEGFTLADKLGQLEDYLKALAIYEKLLAAHPDSQELQRNAALSHKYIGGYLLKNDQDEQAMEHFNAALLLDRKRAEANPDDAQAQLDVTFDLNNMGVYYSGHGKPDLALSNFQRVLEIRRKLLELDPKNYTLQGRVVFVSLTLARTLLKMGKSAEALKYFRSAAELAAARRAQDPADAENLGYLAFARERMGTIQDLFAATAQGSQKQEYQTQACASYRRAYDSLAPNFDLSRMTTLLSQIEKPELIAKVTKAVARCSSQDVTKPSQKKE
jgi:non-specific serine/threonine protein kinase/serine/threonine-protein kinase